MFDQSVSRWPVLGTWIYMCYKQGPQYKPMPIVLPMQHRGGYREARESTCPACNLWKRVRG